MEGMDKQVFHLTLWHVGKGGEGGKGLSGPPIDT